MVPDLNWLYPLALVGSCAMQQEGLKWTLDIGQGTHVASMGKCPESQAISICFFHLVSGASKYMCSSQSLRFSKPCCQLHGFSSQPRKLVFPVLDFRTVVDMWFKLLTPQRGLLSPCNLSPLPCPLLSVQFPTWLLLFPSYLTLRGSFFTPLVV